jgi:hypothetical protein
MIHVTTDAYDRLLEEAAASVALPVRLLEL